MEVDEVSVGEPSTDNVTQTKNSLEKMRVRLAAENYNKPNSYQSLPDDSDDDRTAGLWNRMFNIMPNFIAHYEVFNIKCHFCKINIKTFSFV